MCKCVHEVGACVCERGEGLAPVCALCEQTLLYTLLLPLHGLQEALFLFLQGLPHSIHLGQNALPCGTRISLYKASSEM